MHLGHQRRRRLLSDEAATEAAARPTPASSKRSSGPTETYTSHARRDQQPRLTDLIPTRYRTFVAAYLLGLIVLAAVEVLYNHLDALAVHVVRQSLGVFDLANRGSFAAWFSSLLLSLTAAAAVLIYTLRRHRIDDVRGRYRMWIWAAVGFLLLAVNQTADVDDLVREVVDLAASRAGIGAAWVWPGLCAALAVVCMVRFSFELRRSREALILGWLGALTWLAARFGAGLWQLDDPSLNVMLFVGLKLLGQLTILAAHGTYARYVLLDAHGLLPARDKAEAGTARRRRKRGDDAGDETGEATKSATPARTDLDPPVIAPQPAAETAAKPAAARPPLAGFVKSSASAAARDPSSSSDDDENDADDDNSTNQGLTRAERKRLKRERKAEQRRNAA